MHRGAWFWRGGSDSGVQANQPCSAPLEDPSGVQPLLHAWTASCLACSIYSHLVIYSYLLCQPVNTSIRQMGAMCMLQHSEALPWVTSSCLWHCLTLPQHVVRHGNQSGYACSSCCIQAQGLSQAATIIVETRQVNSGLVCKQSMHAS